MSIARLALRLATVKALGGRTYAGSRVVDSAIETIASTIGPGPTPALLVYTDEASGEAEGRDLLSAGGQATLAIEMAVAQAVQVPVADGENEVAIVIPGTDAGIEITLDLMERQVRLALTDPLSPWAEIWRRLVLKIVDIRVLRGANARKGERFAARRLEIRVETLADPVPGMNVGEVWADFLALAEADTGGDGLAGLAAEIRAQIEGSEMVDWRRAQAALGLTGAGIGGIGLAPLLDHPADPADDPAGLREVALDPLGLTLEVDEAPAWDTGSEREEGA